MFFPKIWVCKIVILEYAKVSASRGVFQQPSVFFQWVANSLNCSFQNRLYTSILPKRINKGGND